MNSEKKKSSKKSGIVETLKTLIYAVLIALVIRTVGFEPFNIPSGSMIPTLLVGDYLFVAKYSYGYSKYSIPMGPPIFKGRIFGALPDRGDVAVFKLPSDNSTDFIKRVIGLPGDKISIFEGKINVNNNEFLFPPNGQFVEKFGNYHSTFLRRNNFPLSADTIKIYKSNQTWPSNSLYPAFVHENYIDVNRNAQFDLNVDSFNYNDDFNNNGIWDYGNSDNIKEFIVPYKGMEIDFDSINNWESVLILLLLDGYSLSIDEWTLDLNDPIQLSRLEGLV